MIGLADLDDADNLLLIDRMIEKGEVPISIALILFDAWWLRTPSQPSPLAS